MNQKSRMNNFDLLRCISMLLIVSGHYYICVSNFADFALNSITYFLYQLIVSTVNVGVNLFVLISGYFLVDSKFSVGKLLKLWVQIFTYSLGIYFILVLTGAIGFSLKELLEYSTPILSRKYWFATEYFRLYLVFPFLNVLLHHLTQKQHKYLIILLVVMNSFFPMLLDMQERLKYLGNWSLWFVTLYIISAYIKRYGITCSNRRLVIAAVGFLLMIFTSRILIDNVSSVITGSISGTDLLTHNNSPLMLGLALSIFLLFQNLKSQLLIGKIIEMVAPLTFGIYLFHEHPSLRALLYPTIHQAFMRIGINSYGTMWLCIGFIIIGVIYVCGCIIEFLRSFLWKRLIKNSRWYQKVWNTMQLKLLRDSIP